MKKFWKFLGFAVSFSIIVVLCYYFGATRFPITMTEGNYYLTEIREYYEEDEYDSTKIEESEYYLEVLKGNKLKSFFGGNRYAGRQYNL